MNPEIWRDIFDAIEDPAFLHDKQFRVLLANAAYCRVPPMMRQWSMPACGCSLRNGLHFQSDE
ncbi:PAS domain-containing protein [Rhodoferax sp.]|uniref:PAS domain-containing protein n=1 Tax=Rhodoferax sp. TaxID=50421 RepID=UPI0027309644|nr:hypothetical protein [Rhodoferax sp.]MDP1529822.1 hypothetical protein [Rhodoferax sp.]MDP1943880.1 hypothetical protein [Rhodoferax sp.]MDP2442847.1 hypothetical protein [Rhodoferax sp.]MDP3866258.1 hypothetical protein [Rhodoferax sp.]MDZ4208588.1 hypothetical protein [Rhodoferax sp.]